MHRLCLLALFAAASVSSSDVIFDGPCPSAKPVAHFDFNAYQGRWYEVARYPNAGEEDTKGKCTTAEYTVFGDSGKVRNTHVVDGIQSFIDGDFTLVGPGRIQITYTLEGRSKYSYLTVLDTDYQNYALGYSCKYFPDGNKHQVFSWIKSRSPVMDIHSKAIVDDYLRKSRILDPRNYIANDFSHAACQAGIVTPITEFVKE